MALWPAVWRFCFDSSSLGREDDVTYLITHRVIKTGLYLKYTWNMPTVNELCTICYAPEDIEHLFINCTSAMRVWKHFLPLLNKVLPFTATKMVDLLLLRIFPVKLDRKSYLLALYLIQLILYQIWLARCSHRMQQKLIHPLTIIKCSEVAIKQQITLCFQTQTTASVKQMHIWRAKDALCMLDQNSNLTFKF